MPGTVTASAVLACFPLGLFAHFLKMKILLALLLAVFLVGCVVPGNHGVSPSEVRFVLKKPKAASHVGTFILTCPYVSLSEVVGWVQTNGIYQAESNTAALGGICFTVRPTYYLNADAFTSHLYFDAYWASPAPEKRLDSNPVTLGSFNLSK